MSYHSTSARGKYLRNANGGSIVLGVAILVLVVVALVLAVKLLENVSLSLYYQGKLNLIAAQAAQYAACLNESDSQKSTATQVFADNLLIHSGLAKSQTVTVVTSNGTVTASIFVDQLPLFGGAGALPGIVSLSGSASTTVQSPTFGYLSAYANAGSNAGNHCWLPIGQSLPAGLNGWQCKHYDAEGRTDFPSDLSGPTDVVTPAN